MLRLPKATTNLVRQTTGVASKTIAPAPLVLRRTNATAAVETLSNPTLKNIEKRWEGMPLQEQAELWMSLRDRMKGDWHDLTLKEKKAAYWIAFGPHGPRAQDPPGEGLRVFFGVMACIGAAGVVFGLIRFFANKGPDTMNQEWQEAANERLKEQRADPLTGISSEGYTGKGQVQSPSLKN